MRDGLVVLQPLLRLGDGQLLLCADLLVFNRGVGEGPGYGIEHCFEQTPHCAELLSRQEIEIGMRLPAVVLGIRRHRRNLSLSV
jgi:hypothetical protein